MSSQALVLVVLVVRVASKRPVRVTVDKTDTVFEVLKAAKNLKQSEHSNVYISLDKSPEERAERRKLVQEMKKKIEENPSQKLFIRKGKICSAEESIEEKKPMVQEEAVVAQEKPQWRPPPLMRPGPGTAMKIPRRPVISETSVDSSDDY